jgi:hypothetical protein
MVRKKKKRTLPKKTKFIVKESYSKRLTPAEVFAEIILSEYKSNCKNFWTTEKQCDIMKLPTVQS